MQGVLPRNQSHQSDLSSHALSVATKMPQPVNILESFCLSKSGLTHRGISFSALVSETLLIIVQKFGVLGEGTLCLLKLKLNYFEYSNMHCAMKSV